MKKRFISLLMVLCLLVSLPAATGLSASAQDAEIAAGSAADYGLAERCEDGNILQCFNWTLAQIKEELPNIAQAGFTSIQTSPLQGHDGRNQWYWLYQPTGFTIGNELGSYNDLKSLCAEADKYGIKIIVDVVANHLAGSNSGTWASSVESALKKSEYFHNLGPCSNYDNRTDVTQKNIGMPDLNSENTTIQNLVVAMLERLRDAGVDGIRWDAAKHIALPSESCAFWSRVSEVDLYQYGEILDAPAGNSSSAVNKALMNEYAEYIGVSDDKYSTSIMTAVRNGTFYRQPGYWSRQGISADRLVLWAESHDTYSNTDGWTKNIDQSVIDKAYALLGARADSQALYLSRPSEKNHTSIYYARKGSTHFTSDEVAAVNHFHNAMVGTEEKYTTVSKCSVVYREGGVVIVPFTDTDVDVSIANTTSSTGSLMVPEGTYVDEVSGSVWTVTASTISGHVGSTGIAVVYEKEHEEKDVLIGDVNLDTEIDIDDATYIQRDVAGIRELSDEERAAADIYQDGSADLTDVTAIQRYLAGLSTEGSHIGETIRVVL